MAEQPQDSLEPVKGPLHPAKTFFLAALGLLAIAFFLKEGVLSPSAALIAAAIIGLLGYFLYAQYRYHQRRLYSGIKKPMGKNRFMTLALIGGETIIVILAALFGLPLIPVALLGLVLIALLIFLLRSVFS